MHTNLKNCKECWSRKLDENLSLDEHINAIVSHGHKILTDIYQIKKYVTKDRLECLVHAVVSGRMDYCNILFIGISESNMKKLSKLQKRAARVVCGIRKGESVTTALMTLHWLQIEKRITFKILLLVHKMVQNKSSANLSLTYKSFNGRPDDFLLLHVPPFQTKYGRRTFAFVGARFWNALPMSLRCEDNTDIFKKKLKTILFDNYSNLKSIANGTI